MFNMFYYRITKYNPKYRNTQGAYERDEWNDYSDIGKKINNNILTFDEYKSVEDTYVNALITIMEVNKIEKMKLINLYKCFLPDNLKFDTNLIEEYNKIETNMKVTSSNIIPIIKLFLRGMIGGKLVSPKLFIHFGYEYYVYVGCAKPIFSLQNIFLENNIFIELQISPQLRWVIDGEFSIKRIFISNGINKTSYEELCFSINGFLESNNKKQHLIFEYSNNNESFDEYILEFIRFVEKKYDEKTFNRISFSVI